MAIGKLVQAAVVEGVKAASKTSAKKAAAKTVGKSAAKASTKEAKVTPAPAKATGYKEPAPEPVPKGREIILRDNKAMATRDTAGVRQYIGENKRLAASARTGQRSMVVRKNTLPVSVPKNTPSGSIPKSTSGSTAPRRTAKQGVSSPSVMTPARTSLVTRKSTNMVAPPTKPQVPKQEYLPVTRPATALPTGMRAVRDAVPTKAAVPGKGVSLGKVVGGVLGGGVLGGALLANEIGGDARKPPIKPAPKPAASKPAGIEIEVKPKQARAPKNPMSAPSKAPSPGKPPANPMSAPVKMSKTKGGDYPVYAKASSEGGSFRSAFAAARKAGKKTFEWQGRKYTTEVKK